MGWIAAGSSCNVIGDMDEFPPGVVGRVAPVLCWRSSRREISKYISGRIENRLGAGKGGMSAEVSGRDSRDGIVEVEVWRWY